MPILTFPITSDGAFARVIIGVSAPRIVVLGQAGINVPPAVIAHGLIDTGASCTCIDSTVLRKLQLEPSGTTQMVTPSTGEKPHLCNQFDVAFALVMDSNQVHLSSDIIPVVESDLVSQGFEVLIGRDVLDQGILIYDGCRRQIALAF